MNKSRTKPTGFTRLILAWQNSLKGFKWLMVNESAFRQELCLLVITLGVVICWQISVYERLLLLVTTLLVLFAEIINTAIEATIDRISPEHHPLSGLAKDLGSAAVLVSLIILILSWTSVIYHQL